MLGSDALQLAMYIGYAVAGIPADLSRCSPILPLTLIILGVTMIRIACGAGVAE
ncbi:MAG: hypothetical protein U0X93_14690 [Anaerolineales bacterium]